MPRNNFLRICESKLQIISLKVISKLTKPIDQSHGEVVPMFGDQNRNLIRLLTDELDCIDIGVNKI